MKEAQELYKSRRQQMREATKKGDTEQFEYLKSQRGRFTNGQRALAMALKDSPFKNIRELTEEIETLEIQNNDMGSRQSEGKTITNEEKQQWQERYNAVKKVSDKAEEYKKQLDQADDDRKERNRSLLKAVGFGALLALTRTIANKITQALAEGTKNLYAWSTENKKEWADIFDRQKSSSTALANAFALVKQYLTIYIQKFMTNFKELLVDILNAIAKALAFIQGEKTYVQARKDIMVRWAENNAETRKLIQGFDTLNVWQGNDNTAPEDMFEEKEFGVGENAWEELKTIWRDAIELLKSAFDVAFGWLEDLWDKRVAPAISDWWNYTAKPAIALWWNEKAKPALETFFDSLIPQWMKDIHNVTSDVLSNQEPSLPKDYSEGNWF